MKISSGNIVRFGAVTLVGALLTWGTFVTVNAFGAPDRQEAKEIAEDAIERKGVTPEQAREIAEDAVDRKAASVADVERIVQQTAPYVKDQKFIMEAVGDLAAQKEKISDALDRNTAAISELRALIKVVLEQSRD